MVVQNLFCNDNYSTYNQGRSIRIERSGITLFIHHRSIEMCLMKPSVQENNFRKYCIYYLYIYKYSCQVKVASTPLSRRV